ncbi:hypothetical protein V5O48_015033, partial [Marasmius crinis-equi]
CDLAPTKSYHEAISKSVVNVSNAVKIWGDYRKRKRETEERRKMRRSRNDDAASRTKRSEDVVGRYSPRLQLEKDLKKDIKTKKKDDPPPKVTGKHK